MLSSDEFSRRFGQAVREAREHRGLTQEELGERMSRQTQGSEMSLVVRAAISALITVARRDKKFTYGQIAERSKLTVAYIRDLEALKIDEPDSYSIYCLSYGLRTSCAMFMDRLYRMVQEELKRGSSPEATATAEGAFPGHKEGAA